ncbi:MAG: aminoglycoside phosphotransferase family protein [Actinomycetota bacterium]
MRSTHLAEARARQALRASGLPFAGPLERASSTHNEIYLGERWVVRINSDITPRLEREASLYAALPDHPWTPVPVAFGGNTGSDYLIVERKPGRALAHHWPDLTPEHRKNAVRQLVEYLWLLHATPTPPDLRHPDHCPQLLDETARPPVAPMLAAIEQMRSNRSADRGLLDAMERATIDLAPALGLIDTTHLIHGDLTFENVLWAPGSVTAIVDFEFSRGGPRDLELDVLLRFCAFPDLHIGELHAARTSVDDYASVPGWLAEYYPALFNCPRLQDRLMLYALSFELDQMLRNPSDSPRHRLDRRHPSNRVASLLATGGYVVEMLGRAGVRV